MRKQRSLLFLILLLVITSLIILVRVPIRLGLDLRGGSQLTIQLQTSDDVPRIDERVLEGVQSVIENRVNGLGVSEAVVQTVGDDQILVQLPGVSDPEQAERVLGGTAQLDFREQRPGTEGELFAEIQVNRALDADLRQAIATGDDDRLEQLLQQLNESNQAIASFYKEPIIRGQQLQDAFPQPTQGGNGWEIVLRFNSEGGRNFAELTKNLAGTGRTIGIFLDDSLLSSPTVSVEFADTGITGGSAVITGNFSAAEANDLAVQLRGGALPVPVEIVENRTVGATLGRDSIQRSIYAGSGGLILVLIFMVAYYRLPGAIADVALVVYALFTLAIFALLGVTLTLPGIAGFILSIGMAVDANVLIFERTREELRAGKTLYRSVESGFYRAFGSILDGNVTTGIACAALFWLGTGLVKGFALTLGLGVAVSMFTAVTFSRTLMFTVISLPEFRKPELFCPNLPKTN
ncbi:MAG: protein translocase subunit SecD [Limnospira sp. PMC 1291.21]|uniref:Protein translocase subunit SecD n=2 Tax=Limnospira TaxID=2596745 RepID=A0A9P1KB34_9CYAN|nr:MULTISPECIES: protein translocase subunit SecD [Limnospira]EKD10090.1 protein-export membrane protein SecD [Arthrospira platensis C1]MDY7052005.1 protein translocase subunit SecD [Limnospira fusiformis LS22]QJB28511.1 protein translocase subunit SecD [Limnospira fusiformis SAG 85.79]MDT9176184.1 protein translocase subunit SecD [Limnospira sp. PMC 1238.20]MDT9186541.1 protein translocase subunit SecD [Limnospira sp. PMC 894.15]